MKVFSGVLKGGDCIGDARSAWLEVWAAAEQGRTAQGHPQGHLSDFFICMLTFQIFPGISLGEEAIQGSILTRHLV